MIDTLTYSKKYKIIIGLACLFLTCAALVIFCIPVLQLIIKTKGNLPFMCFLISNAIIFTAAPMVTFLWVMKYKVELYDDKFKITTLIKTQEINFKDIVSYMSLLPLKPIVVQYLKNSKEHRFDINRRVDPDFKLLKLLKNNNIKFNKKSYARAIFWLLFACAGANACVALTFYLFKTILLPEDYLLLFFSVSATAVSLYSYFINKRKLDSIGDDDNF